MKKLFANVIVPVPLEPTFSYAVPEPMMPYIKVGMRVVVPFGGFKFYTGIVESLTETEPDIRFDIKEIAFLPDQAPILRHPQLKLWEWISEYYLCTRGEVMRAALPSGLKIESETVVECNPDMDTDEAHAVLNEREAFVWMTLFREGKCNLARLSKLVAIKKIAPITNKLLSMGTIIVSENHQHRFRPRKEHYVRPYFRRGNDDALQEAFAKVKGAPRQEAVLVALLDMSNFMRRDQPYVDVTRSALVERTGASTAIIAILEQKGIVERYTREISRFEYEGGPTDPLPALSAPQSAALAGIHKSFLDHKTVLLHGVTASGKTEIYIHLIDYVLKQGLQVLYLVPEIALTTQLTKRIQKVFGAKVVIYHSRFSDNRRVEIWNSLAKNNGPCVVIGARSSVFLPFAKLGLVIVDEEHEAAYKQYDPAPRYNARDVAIVLASMHGAKTLLGSATPSIESYYKALSGKFGLVGLSERYADVSLPSIEIVDMNVAYKQKTVDGSFSKDLRDTIRQVAAEGKQSILFHNRRGYAPLVRCKACASIPKCKYCDVSLTVHRSTRRLECHYCGAVYPMPTVCPVCSEPAMEEVGAGTERVEDDLDTTRNKDGYANIIDDFSSHKADILVGTQMVTKGLDFAGVALVGVVNADAVINYPDFRSTERAFNMLEQVSGRAGRSDVTGRVIVQTREPEHPVLQYLVNHDYIGFYNHEIEERHAFKYPPFARIIYVYVKHRDAMAIGRVSTRYGCELRRLLGNRVFGPEEPFVSRVQNMHIRKIMLKIEPEASISKVKSVLRDAYVRLLAEDGMRGTTVYYDVDPQ